MCIRDSILGQGDRVEIDGSYHVLTRDLDSDALGLGEAHISPELRKIPTATTAVVMGEPLMTVLQARESGWNVTAPRIGAFQMQFQEAV